MAASAIASATEFFDARRSRPVEWRKAQLEKLDGLLRDNAMVICKAVAKDLGRHDFTTLGGDVLIVLGEIANVLSNVETWAADEPVEAANGKAFVRKVPKGPALVIGAYNFPIQLTLSPVVAALSAGCSVVVKPSELTPTCAATIDALLSKLEGVYVVQGGPETTGALLDSPQWGHVFYTGSNAVGQIVLEKTRKHFISCTLELGGKSPCYVHADADLQLAANRIAASKLMNTGQVCIAPDTVFVHAAVAHRFVELVQAAFKKMVPTKDGKPAADFRMVNARHFDRVQALLSSPHGGTVLDTGAKPSRDALFVPPTIVLNPVKGKLLEEEIFGPVLPVRVVDGLDACATASNAGPTPLAAYVFTASDAVALEFIDKVRAGGVCVNECAEHAFTAGLPFGGLGASGMGAYHGAYGFNEFTHRQGVLFKTAPDMPFRFPPHNAKKVEMLMGMIKPNL